MKKIKIAALLFVAIMFAVQSSPGSPMKEPTTKMYDISKENSLKAYPVATIGDLAATHFTCHQPVIYVNLAPVSNPTIVLGAIKEVSTATAATNDEDMRSVKRYLKDKPKNEDYRLTTWQQKPPPAWSN